MANISGVLSFLGDVWGTVFGGRIVPLKFLSGYQFFKVAYAVVAFKASNFFSKKSVSYRNTLAKAAGKWLAEKKVLQNQKNL
ncbi:MAG: hypothetical protein EA393_11665 [Bacteroidetes bacterium]|nr:MAG: hypothetical protein EA393_11665 [Bacteroidota bacterium]